MEVTTLDKVPLNCVAVIQHIDSDEDIRNRIFDMGIMENETIIPLFRSPFKDPVAYYIKNTVIALRNEESQNIFVKIIWLEAFVIVNKKQP